MNKAVSPINMALMATPNASAGCITPAADAAPAASKASAPGMGRPMRFRQQRREQAGIAVLRE